MTTCIPELRTTSGAAGLPGLLFFLSNRYEHNEIFINRYINYKVYNCTYIFKGHSMLCSIINLQTYLSTCNKKLNKRR